MKFKTIACAAILALASSLTFAAETNDFIIPVAGNTPGANGSLWQSEVTLHNAGFETLNLTFTFHDANGTAGTFTESIAPRTTTTINDIVGVRFDKTSATGAITIDLADSQRKKLSVTSRTFNSSPAGEFGQDIPALTLLDSLTLGDTGIISGPANAAASRFNFGIYSIEASQIEWQLLRKDGSLVIQKTVTYPAGVHTQYNNGATTFFGDQLQNNDVVHARVKSGRVLLYGSIVNQNTGDPSYVPGGRTRENLFVEFVGVDLDEDGDVDVRDANGDGRLDEAILVPTSMFPTFLRIIATDPEGQAVTYRLVNPPGDVKFIDDAGRLQWFPSSSAKGTTVNLVVEATDGIDPVQFIIPANLN